MAKATKKQALGRGLSALLKETPNINSANDKNADKLVLESLTKSLKSFLKMAFEVVVFEGVGWVEGE